MLQFSKEPSRALPVKFHSLEVKKQAAGIVATWKVGEEENVIRYEVEKANDGKTFIMAGSVESQTLPAYSFTDQQKPARYYRVKSIDVDGKYQYSPIVKYDDQTSQVILKVFPVPAQNQIQFQHPNDIKGNRITISTVDGCIIRSITANEGAQESSIDISMLQPGPYFLSYSNENGVA